MLTVSETDKKYTWSFRNNKEEKNSEFILEIEKNSLEAISASISKIEMIKIDVSNLVFGVNDNKLRRKIISLSNVNSNYIKKYKTKIESTTSSIIDILKLYKSFFENANLFNENSLILYKNIEETREKCIMATQQYNQNHTETTSLLNTLKSSLLELEKDAKNILNPNSREKLKEIFNENKKMFDVINNHHSMQEKFELLNDDLNLNCTLQYSQLKIIFEQNQNKRNINYPEQSNLTDAPPPRYEDVINEQNVEANNNINTMKLSANFTESNHSKNIPEITIEQSTLFKLTSVSKPLENFEINNEKYIKSKDNLKIYKNDLKNLTSQVSLQAINIEINKLEKYLIDHERKVIFSNDALSDYYYALICYLKENLVNNTFNSINYIKKDSTEDELFENISRQLTLKYSDDIKFLKTETGGILRYYADKRENESKDERINLNKVDFAIKLKAHADGQKIVSTINVSSSLKSDYHSISEGIAILINEACSNVKDPFQAASAPEMKNLISESKLSPEKKTNSYADIQKRLSLQPETEYLNLVYSESKVSKVEKPLNLSSSNQQKIAESTQALGASILMFQQKNNPPTQEIMNDSNDAPKDQVMRDNHSSCGCDQCKKYLAITSLCLFCLPCTAFVYSCQPNGKEFISGDAEEFCCIDDCILGCCGSMCNLPECLLLTSLILCRPCIYFCAPLNDAEDPSRCSQSINNARNKCYYR